MADPAEIEVPVWWSRGDGLRIRRDALDADHPEHTYNYIKRVYGVSPEDYGVFRPPSAAAGEDQWLI